MDTRQVTRAVKFMQETRVFLKSIENRLNMFVALHCYGESVIFPYTYTTNKVPDNRADLNKVAKAVVDAVKEMPKGT